MAFIEGIKAKEQPEAAAKHRQVRNKVDKQVEVSVDRSGNLNSQVKLQHFINLSNIHMPRKATAAK